jgi:hypothetical protein
MRAGSPPMRGQPRPTGIREGNTVVDLVLDSVATLVFVEVKMDAPASSGTTSNLNRNQLARNLDIGYRRAADAAMERCQEMGSSNYE